MRKTAHLRSQTRNLLQKCLALHAESERWEKRAIALAEERDEQTKRGDIWSRRHIEAVDQRIEAERERDEWKQEVWEWAKLYEDERRKASAYAEIVERVAEEDPAATSGCPYCGGRWVTTKDFSQFHHAPGCPYLVARKLRNKA